MKAQYWILLLGIGGLGVVGACSDSTKPEPPPPPPPPPAAIPAPTALEAAAMSPTQIDLAWTDASTNETGFRVEKCSGAGCTNFAELATVAVNVATYSDMGLTASTPYSYRVRAFNADTVSAYSNTSEATTLAAAAASPILVGAGEITNCATTASLQTAAIVDSLLADSNVTVFTAGNNLADEAAGSTYETCFEPKWGAFKDRTYYAVGNGDFMGGRNAAGVYGYLGDRTGPADKGWFSFDLGTWHIVVLNTSTWQHGSAPLLDPNGEMWTWLRQDLATTQQPCIMAISWERRLYTTGQPNPGQLGKNFNMNEGAKALYAAGADVIVSAKDKIYARFPQSHYDGAPDPAGFRQFIVGTGGRSFDTMHPPGGANPSTVEAQQTGSWGVIKFTLDPASYSWEFIPTVAGGFTDSGTTNCH